MTTLFESGGNPLNQEKRQVDEKKCPLCGENNRCGVYDGDCWCFHIKVPLELRERISEAQRGKVCICRQCVEEFYEKQADSI
ncbi:cysteine-rich CWC family protein [Paenibacillus sp. KN14-4R]|uniref:cysteine-rich CWC family protein n=1 Tax=Paenibacillus sp. KN14-4R TaxID=3445773 RepID=UPI003F9F8F53